MAEGIPLFDDELELRHKVLSIGWHLVQGQELSASYAQFAEGLKAPDWAGFFGFLESGYSSLRADAGFKLLDSPFGAGEWWRPPL